MPLSIAFWVLMILWFVTFLGVAIPGSNWIVFALLFLLGWQVFGFVVKKGTA